MKRNSRTLTRLLSDAEEHDQNAAEITEAVLNAVGNCSSE